MSGALEGPRVPAAGATKRLVVFLHGYGADGNDLIELGRAWRNLLPGTEVVSPHAPERCIGAPSGRQWFGLSNRPPDDPRGAEERWNGAVKARAPIDAFLDAELARLGLDDSRLALVGFSQGSMMALHVGLRRKSAPPAILLVHGDQDPLIPFEALFLALDALASAHIPAQWHMSFGVGHGIDEGGLRHGGLFLAQAFALPAKG